MELRLRTELQGDKKDKNFVKRKQVLKKVVASMTMGQVRIFLSTPPLLWSDNRWVKKDMSPLYPDVIACLSIQVLEIKKMVYLYLINYARIKPDMVSYAMDGLLSVRYSSPLSPSQTLN